MQKIQYIDRKSGDLITENPPGESFLKFLYHNPLGYLPLHLLVKRKFLSSWYGKLMDKPKSARKIHDFIKEYNLNTDEFLVKIDDYKCFNEFFYRKLKPSSRPIGNGMVSPADGKILAFEKIENLQKFFVKGNKFNLSSFLDDEKLAQKFQNSYLIIIRLAPTDYHRFHFPFEGIITKPKAINGNYLSVSPYALSKNFVQVFCQNKRSYSILKTENKGDILIAPVGATMVGSIYHTYKNNSSIKKGDEMGYFAFGGSSILLLIDKNHSQLDSDLLENTSNKLETSVKMGEQIGI